MPLDKPDPRYTTSKRAQQNFRLALRLSLAFIGVIWTVFILDEVFGLVGDQVFGDRQLSPATPFLSFQLLV